jgi:RNA exonuclease 4
MGIFLTLFHSFKYFTALEFKVAQAKVAELIDKKILVGHDIRNDLKVLFLGHPFTKIRDTAK